MLSVTKIIEFEAAHFLPEHKGRCQSLHGHRFSLEVEVGSVSDTVDDSGMLLDFGDLKEAIKKIVDAHLDHACLNDLFVVPPTAENIIFWVREELPKHITLSGDCEVIRVRLWETSTSYAEWRKY